MHTSALKKVIMILELLFEQKKVLENQRHNHIDTNVVMTFSNKFTSSQSLSQGHIIIAPGVKGQLISKCLTGSIVLTKKTTKFF